jgi:hypothetical protein
MRKQGHLIRAALKTANSSRNSIGRPAYAGFLIATIGATILCGGGAAHSSPCAAQIAELEQQTRRAESSPGSGPTAPMSVDGLLHHQPTPSAVQNAERKANADADAALQRARQADADGSSKACTKALDEAKHHWVLPA